jgi:hypothetical protein
MFSPSYISSSGSKLHLETAWSPPTSIRPGGCSSPDFDVQVFPLLVFYPISSPRPIGMPNPIIPSSTITFDPSILFFFHATIGLQDFQDHEPYPPIINLFDFQFDPPCKKKKIHSGINNKKIM